MLILSLAIGCFLQKFEKESCAASHDSSAYIFIHTSFTKKTDILKGSSSFFVMMIQLGEFHAHPGLWTCSNYQSHNIVYAETEPDFNPVEC